MRNRALTGHADPSPGKSAHPHEPTSAILESLLHKADGDMVSLRWVIDQLGDRSFGIVMLLAAIIAVIPGVSPLAALLLAVVAIQMILARSGPVLPGFLANRRISIRRLAGIVKRTAPPLRYLERYVRPRWRTPFETTKRVIGAVTVLLAVTLLTPIPFSQVVPATVVALLAVSFLESDGVLLALSLGGALVSLAATAATAWGTVEAGLAL